MHDRGPTYDKERIHLNIARIRKGGRVFEINIDPEQAVAFKEGEGSLKMPGKTEEWDARWYTGRKTS